MSEEEFVDNRREIEDGVRRINTRAFRIGLAKEIASEDMPAVITRHGKDIAALISIVDFRIFKTLLEIGALEQLRDSNDIRNSLGILKKCTDDYINYLKGSYTNEVVRYLQKKMRNKFQRDKKRIAITDRNIENLALFIAQNWRAKDGSTQVFTNEILDDIIDNQISDGILRSILTRPVYD